LPGGTLTVSTVAAPTWAAATRRSLSRLTVHALTANAASANAVASTIVVRTPPGRRATCRSARNTPRLPRRPVRGKNARQASGCQSAATAVGGGVELEDVEITVIQVNS